MAWVPGGTFRMGSDAHYPEEAPVHRVTVDGFWIEERLQEFARYRPAARRPHMIDTGMSHIGLRCVARNPGAVHNPTIS